MAFTDIFIRRPVLASVVSLLIAIVGLRAFQSLTVQEYPQAENAVITVTTVYTGADADLVQGFITTPLEREIASADGIDYLQSFSQQGVSTIQANLKLNYDAYEALTQITSKVNKIRADLPSGSEDPTIDLTVGETTATMYISFYSEVLENNQITDYLTRVVQPQLQTVQGVQKAEILGARTFAMRIWMQPERMAGLGVTPADVYAALGANNVLAAVGQTKGSMISFDLTAETDLHSAEEFKNLVVREERDALIRLGDVASVVLGAESYDVDVQFNSQKATFFGINVVPGANVLDVIADVRELFPRIVEQIPEGLEAEIVYDATRYIEDSISEVQATLIEAMVIVIVVIFLFLGSVRSVIIPAIAVPLSLLGAGFVMLVMGFSINLLTLLALVLAIGMVVDDAIIVVENIHRHIEDGMEPKEAALVGARELGGPIVAMTITLVAVYAPIGLLGGLTGTLFIEFAFTLAGAVLISGIVALTLSPMMCAKLLKANNGNDQSGFAGFLDRQFTKLENGYERRLHGALNTVPVILVFGGVVLISCYFLFVSANSELAPEEDQGIVFMLSTGAPNSTIDQTTMWTEYMAGKIRENESVENIFQINGVGFSGPAVNSAITGATLHAWSDRDKSNKQVQQEMQGVISQIAGLDTAAFIPPPLPGGSNGLPVQFIIGSTDESRAIYDVTQEFLQRVRESGMFIFVESDLRIDKPQVEVEIDREKVAAMGLSMQDIGTNLAAMLSGGYVNRFSIQGRSYKVIPQVAREDRLNPDQLGTYHVRTPAGEMVPLSTVVSLNEVVRPRMLKRFQQLNAATIQGVPVPGIALGDILSFMEKTAEEILPESYTVDYAGQSRQFKAEGSALVATFFFALVIIYLVLAAQFESFVDPIIMLVTVPMSICGALIFISLGLTSLNIYSQVGLVTLIGVISKHGILIVEFANQLQTRDGFDKRTAIEKAAAIRLRPVLMTTAALVIAVVPLITASGPGAASRFAIGVVIASGMTIGTLFTLFVVPGMYMVLGRDFSTREAKVA
ncbi:efflux RND transporter permease subunit [Abyssibacter sp.]|jgi:multidrug efflux pump|uniref:efflux RND transporter permease subunit n=1 Tax=Abyssibacter sp. TaxID=2320200 RepID=UPI0025BA419F|nr:efflux RND transporter permease subunit [Abyssibacter sp.]MCK5858866.1 efflux RND transporter permease subunit [Abyssibacter sp.]